MSIFAGDKLTNIPKFTSPDNLTAEALLRDFKTATEISDRFGELESWVLRGVYGNDVLREIQDDPVAANEDIAEYGLASLLVSEDEQREAEEMIEAYERLDLDRFIGRTAMVKAHKKGQIVHFEVPPLTLFSSRAPYQRSGYDFFSRKTRTQKITSFHPVAGAIRLGEGRHRKFNPFVLGKGFWEIRPFDAKTGEPVVEVELLEEGMDRPMPVPDSLEGTGKAPSVRPPHKGSRFEQT